MCPTEAVLLARRCWFALASAMHRAVTLNQRGYKSSHHSNSPESLSYGVISPFMCFPIHLFIALTSNFSVFSSNKMVTQLMNIDIIVKNLYSRIKFLCLFPFALLGHPHLSYHIHPVNEVIHRGVGIGINTLYQSKCAMISNPKNDIVLSTDLFPIPKLTFKL